VVVRIRTGSSGLGLQSHIDQRSLDLFPPVARCADRSCCSPFRYREHGCRHERDPSDCAALAAIDILSNGRLFVGLGPGSSARDYEIVSLSYDERWKRFDEAIQVLRSLWSGDGVGFTGRFYSTAGIDLEPKPLQKPTPPIWIGSWGSDAGLRRVARLGDGWLASAYNTMPDQFAAALAKLRDQLKLFGKDPASFPNALATMFMYVTEDKSETERVLSETLTALLNRPSISFASGFSWGRRRSAQKNSRHIKPPVFSASLCGRSKTRLSS